MDFEKLLNPPPVVQEKKKYKEFTLREVTEAEIIQFRQMEKAKDELLLMKAMARERRIAAFQAESGQKIASPELKKPSWSEKVAFAQSERERLKKAEEVQHAEWVIATQPKKTFIQRVVGFLKSIWTNANF